MATEIAARAGSHSRRTFDDERCQKRGRQVAERSDSGFPQVLPKLVQMMPVPGESCSPSVRIHCANTPGTQEPLIQVEMGGGDDYALPDHHWPAAASDVWHSLYQLHACAARPMSLLPLRAEPTIRIQIHRQEQGQKQHLCSPSSARTQQSRKAVATGERRCGKNSRSLPSIPRSHQFESQANCHGFGRWLKV